MDIHLYIHSNDEKLDRILHQLEYLEKEDKIIMALIDDLQTGQTTLFGLIDQLLAQSTAQNQQITDLMAQIAAGTPVTAAQLQSVIDSDTAEIAKVQAALPPPVPTPAPQARR